MVDLEWPRPLTQQQIAQLETYRQLLITWNERMNLTAITDETEVYVKHFYDSLAVFSVADWQQEWSGKRGIDIGTGAGFPGIPIAIACPDLELVLCDSLQKRVGFLKAVQEELGLNNVSCIHARSEDLARDTHYRGQFDFVVSRAVARLNILMELMCPFLRAGGLGFSYKGPGVEDERQDGLRAARKLHAALRGEYQYNLPLSMGTRTIVVFEQSTQTPDPYPRKAGIPQRKPL